VAYFMASVDSPERNAEFAKSLGAPFVILSDPDKTAARAFGVLSDAGYAKRWTFYIDSEGIIRHIDRSVEAGSHGAAIAEQLAALGFPAR
jgi:peroxiredoxin Q/BCP